MNTNEKLDLYKLHKEDYATPKKPVLMEIKPATYLSIDGQGEPGGAAFIDKIGALYGAAFTIKMTRKFAGQGDYGICKLEAQWWSPKSPDFSALPKTQWCWKLLIRTPDFIKPADLIPAVAKLIKKGKTAAVKEVQVESLDEGQCVQMLHIGPYDREGERIALMQSFAQKQDLTFHGRHHEIYLSDPRRVAPEKLRTILRMPVKRK